MAAPAPCPARSAVVTTNAACRMIVVSREAGTAATRTAVTRSRLPAETASRAHRSYATTGIGATKTIACRAGLPRRAGMDFSTRAVPRRTKSAMTATVRVGTVATPIARTNVATGTAMASAPAARRFASVRRIRTVTARPARAMDCVLGKNVTTVPSAAAAVAPINACSWRAETGRWNARRSVTSANATVLPAATVPATAHRTWSARGGAADVTIALTPGSSTTRAVGSICAGAGSHAAMGKTAILAIRREAAASSWVPASTIPAKRRVARKSSLPI